jgi:Mor family transcriptional regulator
MNDDAIIKQRIAGKSVRAIAKTQRCSVAQVNEAIDRGQRRRLTTRPAEIRWH